MALYRFQCPECGEQKTTIGIPPEIVKCDCGSEMVRAISGPSATVKERLDNGYMPRALERFSEAERLFRDRAVQSKVPKK